MRNIFSCLHCRTTRTDLLEQMACSSENLNLKLNATFTTVLLRIRGVRSICRIEGAWRYGLSRQWTRPETALVSQYLFSCSPIILETLILIGQLALYSKHIRSSLLQLVARASSRYILPLQDCWHRYWIVFFSRSLPLLAKTWKPLSEQSSGMLR